MNTDLITTKTKEIGRALSKNSPTILTAIGVGGLLSTVALAVKATVTAYDALYQEANFRFEQFEKETGEDRSAYPDNVFTPREVIELSWKYYIPTALMSATTIACMIGSNHISLRRNAALASLFTITERTLQEYQAKVVEQIGEKKAEKIEAEIVQDHLDKNPPAGQTIVLTGKGNYLCYDKFSGRYFRSNIDNIRRCENIFNQRLLREGYLGINDFYYEVGLESIDLGDEMGWIAERNLLEIKTFTKFAQEEPCLVIDYIVQPHHI